MRIRRSTPPRPPVLARILLLVLIAGSFYSWYELKTAGDIYDGVNAQLAATSIPVHIANIEEHKIPVANYSLFRDGHLWTYVNKTNALGDAVLPELIPIPVDHGDSSKPMLVAKVIAKPLSEMVEAARQDGLSLMVASAYRSKDDQKKLYDGFMTERGQAFTVSHVAPPGTSEHQTGMAVDMSSASSACSADSDKCELQSASIVWLAQNAPRFGFIQRYPMGKQSVTGFANEEWHYRYVGVPLAKALNTSDMTFDEFVAQVAPGYARH